MIMEKLRKKMDLQRIKTLLDAEFLCGDDCSDKKVEMVAASDLMSDVLAFIKSGSLLLTGLVNQQVVRTAEMSEVAAICFVRGKLPQEETIKLAIEKKIPLLATKLSMYESCGRLHKEGLLGCNDA